MTDQPGKVLPTKVGDVCGFAVDFDRVTSLVEKGSTDALQRVMGCRQPGLEPQDVLKTVQAINAQHRADHPQDNLPSLTFEQGSDWPSSWGTNNMLKLTGGGHKEQYLYGQTNYSEGGRKRLDSPSELFQERRVAVLTDGTRAGA